MKIQRSIAIGVAAALFATLPALAVSENRKETFIIAEGKHPVSFQHAFTSPTDTEGDAYVCLGYANDGKFSNVGSFKGSVEITRVDPDTGETSVEKLRKQGNLSKNKWIRCVMTGPVSKGDSLVFDYEFRDFRKIRGEVIHVRSSLGKDRMLIKELRGPESNSDIGSPTEFFHRIRTNQSDTGKHPKSFQQVFAASSDTPADSEQLCFGYGNDVKKKNKGKMTALVEIRRFEADSEEPVVETLSVSDDVKDNKAKKCRKIDALKAGDMVLVDFEFSSMPRLKNNTFQVKTALGPRVMADNEIFGPRPSPTDGGGQDPDPIPNSGGIISGADQIAASALMNKSKKTQLWRFKNDQPKHWTVIGPKTRLGNGLGGVDPATTGYGDTIAQAVADYERKMGKLPAGSALSKAEVDALEWYFKIKTAGGPTSCRRDSGGSYHGEFFRPGKGSVHARVSGGIVGCINYFKANGL